MAFMCWNMPLEVVGRLIFCWNYAKIAKNLNTLDDDIPICLVNIIEGFDATLHRTMIDGMRAGELQVVEWMECERSLVSCVRSSWMNKDYIMRRSCTWPTTLVVVSQKEWHWWTKVCPLETLEEVRFLFYLILNGARGNSFSGRSRLHRR